MKEVLNTKISAIEREYIKITKHEAILNEEISQANQALEMKVKKVKEKLESEIVERLEEREGEREK